MTVFASLKSRRAAKGGADNVKLVAPLSGLIVDLADIPDAAFAGKLVGDGMAIDPTSATLCAPADGEVIAVAEARHAVTIRIANGAEILMHVGVETVALAGKGFKLFVRAGAAVKRGDPLIEFDMDRVAAVAKSLISPIIVLNDFVITRRADRQEVARGEFLMEIGAGQAADILPAAAEVGNAVHGTAIVRLPHGIHARPAAEIIDCVKGFSSTIEIRAGSKVANARSVSALMALGAKSGDGVSVFARGNDASSALAAVQSYLEAGRFRSPPEPLKVAQSGFNAGRSSVLPGVSATSGLAVGVAVLFDEADAPVEEAGRGIETERRLLELARRNVRKRLQATTQTSIGADILKAHIDLLDDPELVAGASALIEKGASAAFAWRRVMRDQAAQLRALGDHRMAERAADFVDLERQVLTALTGVDGEAELPRDAVLIAAEIYPSQLLRLDRAHVAGICMAEGGPTSHASILAASMDIPTVVALGSAVLATKPGTTIIVDAGKAQVLIDPDAATLADVRERKARKERVRATALASAKDDCRTADGVRIEALANLVSVAEARDAVANFAEGCGLLRTEFLFLDRAEPPGEEEQAAQYQAIADALGNRQLTIRTLDVGADKSVPYLPLGREDNPALGVRGVRASLAHPELLEAQLRAILRVRPQGRCKIMIPMIASLSELRAVRVIFERAAKDFPGGDGTPLGVMIETPAAAILADKIAAEADFLSIGTNDLAQYALAMDRGNPKVAGSIDALNPAVLRLIAMAGEAGERHGKPVSVCGGLASDFAAAPLLIGMGVTALSATPSRIPELKAFVRTLRAEECRAAARAALDLAGAAEVRAFALESFPSLKDWI